MAEVHYDYIIVGAGAAGCVVAEGLTASGNASVLLLEAGGTDLNPLVAQPVGETQLLETSLDWAFEGEPEEMLGKERLILSRGRCLGGSSSINGQLYFRGHRGDYDTWEKMGNPGWSFDDVLPLFRSMEDWEGEEDEFRGHGGPLRASRGRFDHPLFLAFVEAGRQAGYPECPDFNTGAPEGFGLCQHAHYHWPVLRCSSSYAYLLTARFRRNLKIAKHATAEQIVMEGRRAVGVRYRRKGRSIVARANREVLVCAGPYQSPKLLMLSGIGPGAHLQEHGIEVVHDLPGVGGNLQDQIGSFVQHACTQPITYYKYKNPLHATLAILEWLFLSRGPLSLFPMAASALIRTEPELEQPDIQLYMYPFSVNAHAEGTYDPKSHAYNIHWGVVHPESRGDVRLRSADPHAAPVIRHNYFTSELDRERNRRAFRLARELHAQPALAPYRGDEIAPGPDCQTDDEIDDFTSRYFANHHHACGSCKMGNDPAAVVDPRLRVHGIDGLRVIDSSIMPRVVTGGLSAPSMMIGAKGRDMILEDAMGAS